MAKRSAKVFLSKERLEKHLQKKAYRILRFLKKPEVQIEAALLGDREMKVLEHRYLKKHKKIVDVLAFPEPKVFARPQNKGKRMLGEVYLNWDLYRRRQDYLTYLLIHGILHLLGYQHNGKRDTMEMEVLEKRVCFAVKCVWPRDISHP